MFQIKGIIHTLVICLCLCLPHGVHAQVEIAQDEQVIDIQITTQDAQQGIDTERIEEDIQETIEPLPPAMMDMPGIKLRWINKITARNKNIHAKVGETVKIGGLYMKARACRNASPLENPESAAFVQIWEGGDSTQAPEWVFSGWMFASSPGLSAMDHPIYDVWVLSCGEAPNAAAVTDTNTGDQIIHTQEVTP